MDETNLKSEKYQIAQVNIGKILGLMDGTIMRDFAVNLEPINQLAEQSKGFVWRLKDEEDNATNIKVFEDDMIIINMSVWETIDDLFKFTYQTQHADFLKRRREWFERLKDMYMVLWYIPAGNIPAPQDAIEKLKYVNEHGDTPHAFSFRNRFSVEDFKQTQSVK